MKRLVSLCARSHRRRLHWLLGSAVALYIFFGSVAAAQTTAEWSHYAADAAATKYSPLDQINRENVHRLSIAWRWKSIDYGADDKLKVRANNIFETTPAKLPGRLMLSTGLGLATSIDPANGEIQWVYNPFDEGIEPSFNSMGMAISRGGTAWSDGDQSRLIFTSNGYLVSLDARTGKPDPSFGDNGKVDLRLGVTEQPLRQYFWTSPPTICRETIVVGNSTVDFATRRKAPPGHLRGYDVRTGEQKWLFFLIPREGELGYDTWEDGAAEYTGSANVWSFMSCDEELGRLYAPTTTPSDDWYGGHRPGDGLFAESVLCLDIETGELALDGGAG